MCVHGLLTSLTFLSSIQKLVEWHKSHPDALLGDMQDFLRAQCGLEISLPTISRQIRKSYGGTFLREGVSARRRLKRQREAEGRPFAAETQQQSGHGGGDRNGISNNSGNGHGDSNGETNSDGTSSSGGGNNSNLHAVPDNYAVDQIPGPMPYHDQHQLAPPPDLLLLQGLQEAQ